MDDQFEPLDPAIEPFREDGDTTEVTDEAVDWGGGDLESAYLKAMMALEASEMQMPVVASTTPQIDSAITSDEIATSQRTLPGASAILKDGQALQINTPVSASEVTSLGDSSESSALSGSSAETPVVPRQIIEACLFVGGGPLTSKRMSGILRGEFDTDIVDREIDELNRGYAAEGRPYEIRLGDGGYRLALRDEYERIRHKVYGIGPKEVRLSQEALEVLAVVAYHQPIKQSRVEELGKPSCESVLRQLVRRELLAVERDPEHPREVSYKTTPRFLSLFGIRSLDDLPRHEQVSYK